MDIKKIDKNFDTSFKKPDDLVWHNSLEKPFKTYGVFYSYEEEKYRRVEKEVADNVNYGVSILSTHTAGGRIRFLTNSPYIAIRVEDYFFPPFSHMSAEGIFGVTLFKNHEFLKSVMPSYDEIKKADNSLNGNEIIEFSNIVYTNFNDSLYLIEIFMPLYSDVKNIYIGLKKDSLIKEPFPYKNELPVIFYGSSITQGACADKSSDDYINLLSRKLNMDVLNLGFSGSARGEDTIKEYIADKKACAYVIDYHYNAKDAEHLDKTHYSLYKRIREKNPLIPIILCTTPSLNNPDDDRKERNKVILNSYNKAKSSGDNNVYLVDFCGVFGNNFNDLLGSTDNCHPNSLGFYRMAEKLYPLLNRIINE